MKPEGDFSFLFGDETDKERAEMKDRRKAKNLRESVKLWIEGLELHLVEATEYENGEGVGNWGWAKEFDATDTTLAILLKPK